MKKFKYINFIVLLVIFFSIILIVLTSTNANSQNIKNNQQNYKNDIIINLGYKTIASDNLGFYAKDELKYIKKLDIEPPTISLNGTETVYLPRGNRYMDEGYIVLDNFDDKVIVTINTDLNINIPGSYTYEYIATDKSGNISKITRNIVVYDNQPGVIYLTFDDGPSDTGTTQMILDILKEENVKATFFVTGNGPEYLIKKEYDEGHTIALHTNSHNYSYIYSSVDNYFSDLEIIKNKVYNITGEYTNIIRFPGGSNNTVSNMFSYGIMSYLPQMVIDRGYIYFDWNVCAEDAGACNTSECVYNTTVSTLAKNRNNIVLMHDVKWTTVEALSDIIHYAKENGYVFKTIDANTVPVRFN